MVLRIEELRRSAWIVALVDPRQFARVYVTGSVGCRNNNQEDDISDVLPAELLPFPM